jgi:CubicO group peptidase (beta-lactamase class C family)
MPNELVAELREIVETERARFGVPGCAVLVVADGEIVMCEGFGWRNQEDKLPVTDRTLFPIGSSTKTFTAAVCALLVESGRLGWDRPVREYLPGFRMADPVASEQLTVYDMLCHRSGLPRHDLLWYAADGAMTRSELVSALGHLPANRKLRESWQYNNLLYAAAGELAARLSGTSYEGAVRSWIFEPLGMRRSNFSVDDLADDPDVATPYSAPRPGEPLRGIPFARLDLVGAAGNINSCAEEMGRWLLTLLGRGVGGRAPLLSTSALAMLQSPAAPLPEGSLLAVGRPVGYCLGLMLEDYRGHRLLHHGGNIDGFSSQVSFVPEAGCGVVVLTNREGTALRDVLPCVLFDRILGLPEQPHGERLLDREQALHRGFFQAADRTVSASIGLGPVRPLDDYVGRYSHRAYGALEVARAEGGLGARYRKLAGPLRHRHLEVFNLLVDLGGTDLPLPVQFTHNLDGDVTAALVRLEPAVDPIRFDRVPDDSHLSDEVLDELAGTYRLGPVMATITRRGEHGLTGTIAQGPPKELKLVAGFAFTIDGARIEFTDDHRLVTPMGEFVPVDR